MQNVDLRYEGHFIVVGVIPGIRSSTVNGYEFNRAITKLSVLSGKRKKKEQSMTLAFTDNYISQTWVIWRCWKSWLIEKSKKQNCHTL